MFHDIEQNTDAWLDMRAGKVTGSSIAKVMANFGKAFGQPAKDYAATLATERLRGARITGDRYNNKHMEAGHVEEPMALALYEHISGKTVASGGFYDNGKTGCSPDGNILFENAGIEIKSVMPHIYAKAKKDKAVASAYKWQVAFNIRECGYDYIDYITYCEQAYHVKREKVYYQGDEIKGDIVIINVTKESQSDNIDMISERLESFEKMVDDWMEILQN